MKIVVRFSDEKDLDALMAIDNIAWVKGTTPSERIHWDSVESFRNEYPPGSMLVAMYGDTVCGYIQLQNVTPLPSNRHVCELAMAVHPDHHGRGIGQELMRHAENWARSMGKTKLCLRVLSCNEKAVRFYTKCGFLEQGRLVGEFDIDGELVDDLLLYKMLLH
ncbi:GNAT family N-acetyltransferase [Fictibacillus iocasae]|uniref:GNAT family N-acetyltransferase n=1 Tax=Fictibacillus iocasae TaxID=2715437 RepID=A0ABW2NPV0_9BACL